MFFSLLAAAASATALPPRPLRDFGDWTVGCDNGRKCQAVALVPEGVSDDELPFATLAVERGAANLDQPALGVRMDLDEIAPLAAIVIDGQRARFPLQQDGQLHDPSDALALLRQLSHAQGARVLDLAGKPVARISLTGAAAALRWMDEQQLRTHSGTAVVAMGTGLGPQSAPLLPRIVAPPTSKAAPRTIRPADIAAIRTRYECGRVAESHVTQTFRLDARTTLAIVPCMLHAYQSSSIVLLLPEAGPWRPVPLERRFASDTQDPTPEWMTEPEYDAETRELWSAAKGRGIGDCGSTEGYIWDGNIFRLAFMAGMDRCQGSRARITLWRTANHPEP
jgi:hypothetical protein